MPTAVAADPQTRATEVVRHLGTIATLPEVTAQVMSTVEDPKSTANALKQIVSHDPALVTRVLKVVNSSFYGLPGQVSSIERAIVLLGLNSVKNIAVAASLGQMFRGAKLCEGFTAKDLWTHCVSVAVVARELAKQTQPSIAEEAFLAGMIHDIGILVSLQLWPEKLRQVCEKARTSSQSFCEIETEILGLDHQNLGLALTQQWKFPQACQLTAGHHHEPQTLEGDWQQLVSIVHVADVICCQTKHGFNLTAINETADDSGIDSAIIQDVSGRVDALITSSASLAG